MPRPSFVICIDESGDQGFTFTGENRSTEWFVIAGVVCLDNRVADVNSVIREAKQRIGWKIEKPLHFKRVKPDRRECVVRAILEGHKLFRAIAVLIHKPTLVEGESLSEQNRLYFYYTRYLLERASWLCRDSREASAKQHGDGTAKVIFSSMNEVSRVRVGDYFKRLQSVQTEIDWSTLKPDQFETLRPGKHSGLQVADVIAGSFYCPNHHCEGPRTDEWVRLLRPVMYRSRRGKYQGYGIKLCPKQAENENAQNALAPWAYKYYPL